MAVVEDEYCFCFFAEAWIKIPKNGIDGYNLVDETILVETFLKNIVQD